MLFIYKYMKKILLILLLSLSFLSFVSNFAFAETGSYVSKTSDADIEGGDMMQVLCNVLRFVRGGIGKTIASFVIIGVGLGFFTGKCSWGLLIGVTLGISCMFGAPAIINALTGGTQASICVEKNL